MWIPTRYIDNRLFEDWNSNIPSGHEYDVFIVPCEESSKVWTELHRNRSFINTLYHVEIQKFVHMITDLTWKRKFIRHFV